MGMESDRIELMFEILRDIRATQDSHGKLLADHSEQFKAMRKEMHDWQETTATAGRLFAPVKPAASNIDSSLRAEGEAIQESRAASGLLRLRLAMTHQRP
jgi:hypothetical protein